MSNVYTIESGATLTGTIRGSSNLTGIVTSSNNLSGSLQITRSIEDHRLLNHRDSPGQHTISAITDLESELDNKVTTSDVISNLEIENILRGFV